MANQASWNGETWGVTSSRVRTLENFNASAGVKLTVDDEEQTCSIKGFELETISFSFIVSKSAGSDPRAEIENLRAKVGEVAPFYLNSKKWGSQPFILTKAEPQNMLIDGLGNILKAEINVEFLEYDETVAKQDTIGADIKIFYDGVDITDKITINSLYYDSYSESQADSLKIVFNDINRLWDGWSPQNEKDLRLTAGRLDTGRMFVHSVKPVNGTMTLTALSIPPTAKNETSKSWEKVRFLQLVKEVADRHGLLMEAHGIIDRVYSYVRQSSVPDFEFLEERVKLEGCAFLVFDKKLVLYSEKDQEAKTPVKTITLKENSHFAYINNSAKKVKSFKVVNSEFTGTYETEDTDSSKENIQKLNIKISNQEEANRFAKNLLRANNKTGQTGEFKTSFTDDVAAGSVVNLQTVGVNSWSGPAFVYHIRHDLLNNKSKIWLRRPIND